MDSADRASLRFTDSAVLEKSHACLLHQTYSDFLAKERNFTPKLFTSQKECVSSLTVFVFKISGLSRRTRNFITAVPGLFLFGYSAGVGWFPIPVAQVRTLFSLEKAAVKGDAGRR